MSGSIKDEYITPEKPALQSNTIKSVAVAVLAVFIEHVLAYAPAIAMFIFTILPSWLQNLVTLEVIQTALQGLFLAIAGAAGVTIVKERVRKGDISGIIKTKV